MRQIDRMLAVLREHPDGMTTLELGREIYGERPGIISRTYSKAQTLAKYGLVSLTHELRPNVRGAVVSTAVWRPVQ